MDSSYSWSIFIILCVLAVMFLFIIRCWFPKPKSRSSIIRCRYGNHVLKIIRRYQKLDYCIRKLDLDIKFLNTSQKNDLCPTFIQYKISSTPLQNSNSYRQSQRLFTQEELTFKNVEQGKIILETERIKSDLRIVINFIDWTQLVERFWRVTSNQSKGLKQLKVTNFQSLWVRHYNITLTKLYIISPLIDYLILKSYYYEKVWIFHYTKTP